MSRLLKFAVLLVVVLTVGVAVAQQPGTTTKTESKEVEIVYVHGNTVVFLMDDQVLQRDVPADFRVNVDGQMVPVSELKPGQKVMIERTTTTTTVPPEKVVTVRNGEVVNVSGRTLVSKEGNEVKKIVPPTDFKFMVEGKKVALNELRPGMKLTATIVKETPGRTTESRSLKATGHAPAAPAPAAETAPALAAPAPEPAPAAAPEPAKKKLPKTASPLPLMALAGSALFVLGSGLSALRRRRS